MGRVILASASPRRRELLKLLFDDFDIVVSDCDETVLEGTAPERACMMLSERKAMAVQKVTGHEERLIIASDTIVCSGGSILGKPADEEDARRMLRQLSGRWHEVYSGICALKAAGSEISGCRVSFDCTRVRFNDISDEELDWYIGTGEWTDKAGAYGIQGFAARFIEKIDGCYHNVVGLPVSKLYGMLKEAGEI